MPAQSPVLRALHRDKGDDAVLGRHSTAGGGGASASLTDGGNLHKASKCPVVPF